MLKCKMENQFKTCLISVYFVFAFVFNNFSGTYCPKGLDTNGTLGPMLGVYPL